MRVVVERVSKTFVDRRGREVVALRQVDLAVESQEFVALLGPSGCGKSTLLNIIAGLLPATSGQVYFEGEARLGRPTSATVFQEFALFPWRTVRANVEFGLEELDVSGADRAERTRRCLEMTGLAGFEGRYPHQLSGGMRQRVGIARALAVEPAVLLMDEPFSALDAQTRTLMMEELLAIWARTRQSILCVTHNIQDEQLTALETDPSRVKQFNAVRKALGLMETNLRSHSLQTHEFHGMRGPNGAKVFESYAQNRTPVQAQAVGGQGRQDPSSTTVQGTKVINPCQAMSEEEKRIHLAQQSPPRHPLV